MSFARLDDAAMARRSVHGYCETVAALGRCGLGMEEVRLPNAVGAKAVDRSALLAKNHYFDAVVVPYDSAPPGVSYLPLSYAVSRKIAGGATAVVAAFQLQIVCIAIAVVLWCTPLPPLLPLKVATAAANIVICRSLYNSHPAVFCHALPAE